MLESKLKASLTGLYSHKRAIAEILKNERKLQVETYFLVDKLLNAIKDKITLFLFFLLCLQSICFAMAPFPNTFFLFSLSSVCMELFFCSQHVPNSRKFLTNLLVLKYAHVAQNSNIYGDQVPLRKFEILTCFPISFFHQLEVVQRKKNVLQ